ncbi:MAG: LamG domain-containing protein [Planctomycetota bacterium]
MKRFLLVVTAVLLAAGQMSAQLNFIDDFEGSVSNRSTQTTGTFPTWTGSAIGSATYATTGRIRFGATAGGPTPTSGSNHATIDSPTDNTETAGAIDYSFDLSGYTAAADTILVEFQWADTGDETDAEDAAFYSLDGGTTWNLLTKFTPGSNTDSIYNQVSVDLSALLVAATQSYTANVVIRFQQQDNFTTPTDGLWFDDIRVYEDVFPGCTPSSGSGFTGNDQSGFDISVDFGATLTNATLDCDDPDSSNIDATITTTGAAPGITQPSNVTGGAVVFQIAWTGTAGTTAATYTYTVTLSDGANQTVFDVRIRVVDPNIPGHLYYQFNEGTGSTTANLGGGGAANGTFSAAPTWDTTTQALGAAAVTFTSETLTTGLAGSAIGTNDFTIEFWIRTSSTGFEDICFDGGSAFLILDNGSAGSPAGSIYYGDSAGALPGVTPINDGSWHHFALVRSGTTVTSYVDGTQDAQTTLAGNWIGGAFQIGGAPIVGATLQGSLDEFRLWDDARTPSEIAATIATELGGSGPFAPVAASTSGSAFTGNTVTGFSATSSFATALANFSLDISDADTANINATITTTGAAPGVTPPSNVTAGAVPFALVWTGVAGSAAGTYTYTVTLDDGGLQTVFDVRITIVDPNAPGYLYYQFNEGTGSTTANLGGAGSANPSFSATPGWDTTTQQLGAAAVTLTTESLNTGLPGSSVPGDFTLEMWLRTTVTVADIFGDTGVSNFLVVIDDGTWGGTPGSVSWLDLGGAVSGATAVNDGNWHHIAITQSGNTLTIYVDGTQDAQGNSTGIGGGNLILGTQGTVGTYAGSFDEFRLWDVARTPSLIAANMNNEIASGDPEINVQESSGPTDWANGSTQNIGDNVTGVASTGTLIIQNIGSTNNLNITSITATPTGVGNCTINTTALAPASPIGPGAIATFDGTITPIADGPFEATITIVNDDADEGTYTIIIQGNGVSPEIDVQRPVATSIADGGSDTVLGTVDSVVTTLTYTIENSGAATGDLDDLNVVITPVNNCAAVLNGAQPAGPITAGNTVSFSVDVTPNSANAWSFTITIDNNDANENPYNITVSGTASATPTPQLQASRTTTIASGGTDTVFGSVDAVASNLTYTLSNVGSALLTFSGNITVTAGTGAPAIGTITQPGATIAAGSNDTFSVAITPSTGVWTATVSIPSDDPNSPYTFTISGDAQATAAPEIAVVDSSNTDIANGSTYSESATGTANFSRNFSVQNQGAAALTLTPSATPVVIGALNNCSVTVTSQPASSIAAASSSPFILSITPTAAGTFSFTVTIANDDTTGGENPFVFTYSGNTAAASSGGGGGGDDGGCSTGGTSQYSWMVLLGLLSAFVVFTRVRGSKA